MCNPATNHALDGGEVITKQVRGVLRGMWKRMSLFLPPLVGIVLSLAALEAVVRLGVVDAQYLPPPSEVLRALGERLQGHGLFSDVWDTLSGWAMGLGIATALA